MNPEPFRDQRRQESQHDHQRHRPFRMQPRSAVMRFEQRQNPTHAEQHCEDIRDRSAHRDPDRRRGRARAHQHHDIRENSPAGNIVHRRARDGHHSHPGSKQLALRQDPSQHRERGDTRCRAHEKSEAEEIHARVRKLAVEQQRQHAAEAEGRGDARLTDQHRGWNSVREAR